jgi:cytidine deaminase
MKDGKEIPGVCVDNACYGSSICAERSAIFNAVALGYRKGDFKELHCLCAESRKVSTSCFACRQVISEFFERNAPLYFYARTGESVKYTVAELCPYPFDADDLQ